MPWAAHMAQNWKSMLEIGLRNTICTLWIGLFKDDAESWLTGGCYIKSYLLENMNGQFSLLNMCAKTIPGRIVNTEQENMLGENPQYYGS